MAVLERTGVKVVAEGADEATAALRRFSAAEEQVGKAGASAGVGFAKLNTVLEGVTSPAGKALQVFNDLGDVFKLTAAGLAGGALFGGLQDIADAYKQIDAAVRELMSGVDLSMGTTGAEALRRHKEAAKETADAERELTKAIQERYAAQEQGAVDVTQRMLSAIGPGATDEAIRDALSLGTRLTEARQGLTQALQDAARKGGLGVTDADLARVRDYQERVEAAERAVRGMTQVGAPVRAGSTSGGAAPTPEPIDRRGMEASVLGGLSQNITNVEAEGAAERAAYIADAERQLADARSAENAYYEMTAAHVRELRGEAEPLRDAFAELGDSFDGFWGRLISSSLDGAGMVAQAINTMTTALGSMVTNIIISGEAGAKGIAKAAGNALAGLSAQAFGYGIMLELLALAAAIPGVGPILGFGAAGLATAGAAMLAGGATLAVMARGLGADKIGGGGAGGRGRSGGASLAGSSPDSLARPGPAAPVSAHYTIVLDGAPIYDGMIEEDTRRARSGGSRQRLGAMA